MMNLTTVDGPKLAEIGVSVGRDVHKVDLDYTVNSLTALDSIAEALSSGRKNTEAVQNTLFVLGCYLGEVICRNANGQWLATAGTPMEGNTPYPLVVEIKTTGAVCNPIGKVFKRFENGPEDSLPAFYHAVEAYRGE